MATFTSNCRFFLSVMLLHKVLVQALTGMILLPIMVTWNVPQCNYHLSPLNLPTCTHETVQRMLPLRERRIYWKKFNLFHLFSRLQKFFFIFFFCSFITAYMSRARPGQGPRLNLNLENSLAITTEFCAKGLSLPALLWLSEFLHNMPFPTFFPLCLMFLYFLRCCRIVETANCGQ